VNIQNITYIKKKKEIYLENLPSKIIQSGKTVLMGILRGQKISSWQ